MNFLKKHYLIVGGSVIGVLVIIIICGFAFGRHHGERGFGGAFGLQHMEQQGMMGPNGIAPGMPGVPGIGGPGEEQIQKHLCQSGSLQSGATQQLLLDLDLKINNLTLIKTNMQSMAQRTNVAYSSGDMASLDQLLSGFDAQRTLLESNPESFCATTGAWTTLNESMRKIMMENISGQVSKFKEEAKRGEPPMMRRFGR